MTGQRLVKWAPSILTVDWGHLADQIQAVEVGGAQLIHLDVMDGMFVPNITFGPAIVATVRKVTSLPLDVHLMIQEPDRYLADFVAAGANQITVHVEACLHLNRTVHRINELGCAVGVALNPATPLEAVREILPFIDCVLVMSVNPGFGGQRFIETTTSKLRRMHRLLEEFNPTCDLQVDGGINATNVNDVVRSGANLIVVGSSVYNDQASPAENLTKLRQAIEL